jgi:hypothetical protein
MSCDSDNELDELFRVYGINRMAGGAASPRITECSTLIFSGYTNDKSLLSDSQVVNLAQGLRYGVMNWHHNVTDTAKFLVVVRSGKVEI